MKRIISLLVCVSFVFCLFSVPTVFSNSTQNDIILLNNLGFSMLDANNKDEVLKRDVFAYLMYGLCTGANYSLVSSNKSVFEDVSSKNEYAPYISALYETGYIKGVGDNKYAPGDNATLNQLTNVIIKILGYPFDNLSENEISNIAVRSGLYNDVAVLSNGEITLSDAAKVIVNALDAKMYFDDEFKDYEVEDNTLLNVNFGLYTVEGIFFTGEASGKTNDYISINNVIYEAEYKDIYQSINGYLVRAYINILDDKICYVDKNCFANEFYYIEARDVISATNTTLTFYDKSDKEKSVKIDGLTEVYNGKITDLNYNDFVFSNGSIVLVGDGTYNTVVINKFDTMVVGAAVQNTVYDYYDSSFSHKFDETALFLLDDEKIDISSLQRGDVLSVAYSKDNELCTVYVSRDTVTGFVSEIEDDSFIINRKTIFRSNYFAQYVADPKLGSEVTIALDHLGRAVAITDEALSTAKYAYFMDLQLNDNTGKEYIEVLNYDGKIITLNLSDKVKVNGKNVKGVNLTTENDLATALKTMVEVTSDGTLELSVKKDYVCQIIKYKTNQDGEVNYIDTAIEGIYEDETCLVPSSSFSNLSFKSGPSQFAYSYGVKKDTVCFFVPETSLNTFDTQGNVNQAKRDDVDEKDFVVGTSYLSNDNPKYTAKVYDVSDGGFAQAIVIDGSANASVDRNSQLLIVEKITRTTNAADDETYKVKGYLQGKEVSYVVADPEDFLKDKNDLSSVPQSGDILQISTNYSNEIVNIVCCYDITGKIPVVYTDLCGSEVGYAYSKDEDGFILTKQLGVIGDKVIVSSYAKQNVYIYDSEEEKVSLGNLSDMVTYQETANGASKVYVRSRYHQPQDFVIYK